MSGAQVLLTELFHEDTDGQYIDVNYVAPGGQPMDTDAIVSVHGSLYAITRSNSGAISYSMGFFTDTDLLSAPIRATFPHEGTIRITLLREDLLPIDDVAIQERSLSLHIIHSVDKHAACEVLFQVQNLGKIV